MAMSKGASRYGAKSNLATSGRINVDPPKKDQLSISKQRIKGDPNRKASSENEAIHLGQTAYVDRGGHTIGLAGKGKEKALARRRFLTHQNYLEAEGKKTQYED